MRYWSILFALTLVLGAGAFVYAPLDDDWWLPNYLATNRDGYAELKKAAEDARPLARTGTGLAAEAGRVVKAKADPGATYPEVAKKAADLRAKLDKFRPIVAAIAEKNFLPGLTRAAAEKVGEASLAIEGAESALNAPGKAAAAAPLLEKARDLIAGVGEDLSRGVEDVHVPTSKIGRDVDHLFIICLAITGICFIGTQLALTYVTWKYPAEPGRRGWYMHGSQRLEVVWTIIPAAILVFIALYQMGTWSEIKFRSQFPKVQPLAEVTARQFQWIIRYPGDDGRIGTADDLYAVNDLHFVKDKPVVIHLKSQDVLHSFFLPQMRVKQDAVPGLTIPVWFDADKAGRYELVCAELCGWGHYKMRANVTVHESQREFEEWMKDATREQNRDSAPQAVATAAAVAGR